VPLGYGTSTTPPASLNPAARIRGRFIAIYPLVAIVHVGTSPWRDHQPPATNFPSGIVGKPERTLSIATSSAHSVGAQGARILATWLTGTFC
jgi:hypothetical protein